MPDPPTPPADPATPAPPAAPPADPVEPPKKKAKQAAVADDDDLEIMKEILKDYQAKVPEGVADTLKCCRNSAR